MTFSDPNLQRPSEPGGSGPENTQDVIPPTERNKDPLRGDQSQGLLDGSRPLTEEEKKAADRDAPPAERVYAPASERVPKEPVAGHRDFVEHPDTHTPERESVESSPPPPPPPPASSSPSARPSWQGPSTTPTTSEGSEPSFTRVARPSTNPTPAPYDSPMGTSSSQAGDEAQGWGRGRRRTLFFGIGFSWFTVIATAIGVWLFVRWRRERNKPINRLRRQAEHAMHAAGDLREQAAAELRERVPNAEEAARPAMGLTTALVSIGLILWQQAQSRSRTPRSRAVVAGQTRKAREQADRVIGRTTEAVADVDWQKRLQKLKERWTPSRVELEKTSLSRH